MQPRKMKYIFVQINMKQVSYYAFKCTSKASSICMTARDDNDERAFAYVCFVK